MVDTKLKGRRVRSSIALRGLRGRGESAAVAQVVSKGVAEEGESTILRSARAALKGLVASPSPRKSCLKEFPLSAATLDTLDMSRSLHSQTRDANYGGKGAECKDQLGVVVEEGHANNAMLHKSVSAEELEPEAGHSNNSVLRKSVSFHEVGVREYARTLGDHPDTAAGPPLTIEWEYDPLPTLTVDEYEGGRGPRRSKLQLLMHPNMRRRMLKGAAGFTDDELRRAERESIRAARRRRATAALLQVEGLEVAAQSLRRKVMRGSWRSGDDEKIRRQWEKTKQG